MGYFSIPFLFYLLLSLFIYYPLPSLASVPWLTVRPVDRTANPNSTRSYIIADEYGRDITLRGACVENEERNLPGTNTQRSQNMNDYLPGQCPQNYNTYQEPPICEVDYGKGKYNQSTDYLSSNDFAQIRILGFNIIRLCLSWSELEPTPGTYSSTYIDRVEQIVNWADEQDVYVILDMHEDDYSQFIYPGPNETGIPPILTPTGGAGNDGAAPWAINTGGFPSWGILGIGNLNLAMMNAFQQFYDNAVLPNITQGQAPGPGLQDHYIGAIAALAQRFVNRSIVAGYEIINEPQPGFTLDPFTFASNYLYPLSRRVIQAITGIRDGVPTCLVNQTAWLNCSYPDLGIHDTKHLFFVEPNAIRNLLDFSPQVNVPITNYTNVVHTPHTYTHVFTIDRILLPYGINISWYPPSFSFAYQTAWEEANNMTMAVFVTEFGTGVDDDPHTLIHTLDAQEEYMTGATLWSWKSNCYSSDPNGCQWAWTVYFPTNGSPSGPINQTGPLDPERVWLLSRTHVRGAVGEMLSYFSNRTTHSFYMFANVTQSKWDTLGAFRSISDESSTAPLLSTSGGGMKHTLVTKENYYSELPRDLSANGTLTEIYIPPSIPFGITTIGTANVSQIVTWPDGSRTAYIVITGPGVYGVLVWNGTTSTDKDIPIPLLDISNQYLIPIETLSADTLYRTLVSSVSSSSSLSTVQSPKPVKFRFPSSMDDVRNTLRYSTECRLLQEQSVSDHGSPSPLTFDQLQFIDAPSCILGIYLSFVNSTIGEAAVRLGRTIPIHLNL